MIIENEEAEVASIRRMVEAREEQAYFEGGRDARDTFTLPTTNVDAFVEAMNGEHRTHQQDFTRLCVAWLTNCGSADYRYDLRNSASASLGEAFVNSGIDTHLPRV